MDRSRAQLAISLLDLTNLRDDCDADAIDTLCSRAVAVGTAAVCVWPDFVAQATRLLADHPVGVATVVNFPSGAERAFATSVLTERALADGADEIDVVLPFAAFTADDRGRARDVLAAVREATVDRAVMKVILETGELADPALIGEAARFAIEHGADFIKTSTGKTKVSATPEAVEIMLGAIAEAGRPVGLKPSGGISTADDAERYLSLAAAAMGEAYLAPATFRFGASGVLDALLAVGGDEVAAGAVSDSY